MGALATLGQALSGRRPDDDLALSIGGQRISGWEDIGVTLIAEGFPNSFEVTASALDPQSRRKITAKAGDACQVMLGGDVVITGYIDRATTSGAGTTHSLQLVGRGKTQDLVDCSAEWPSGQIAPATVFDIATKLAAAYGITVRQLGAAVTTLNPQFNLNYGESGASIIQRLARAAGLLAYEDATGALVLSRVGSTRAASGAIYGQNVQAWTAENSMDGRFSDIVCTQGAENVFADTGEAGFFFAHETDPNVPRHRLSYLGLLSSADPPPQIFTGLMAKWEIARRAGRANAVSVTVDSWRDSAGTLWEPNMLVPVDVPGFLLADKTLCISSVNFRRNNEEGTVASLTLLPPSAFAPEPISLQPIAIADVSGPDAQ